MNGDKKLSANPKNNSNEVQQILLEEFKVLHGQIVERSQVQQKIISSSNYLSVGAITILFAYLLPFAISENDFTYLNYFLLLVPLSFYLLIEHYLHSDYFIAVTAGFIHNVLRKQLIINVGENNILLNEFWFEKIRKKNSGLYYYIFRAPMYMLFVPTTMLLVFITYFFNNLDSLTKLNFALMVLLFFLNGAFFYRSVHETLRIDRELENIIKEGSSEIEKTFTSMIKREESGENYKKENDEIEDNLEH